MDCTSGPDVAYEFDGFRLDPARHLLAHGQDEIGLEPKAFAVLEHLVARAGRVCERHALLDAVWGHRHVTTCVLSRCVAQLRRALGDDARHPLHIQTVHTLGYRFIADVTLVEPPAHDAHPPCRRRGDGVQPERRRASMD